MDRFNALLASKTDAGTTIAWTELGQWDLMEGDVIVRVSHTTINYKDGLALTGKAPIIRTLADDPRHRLRRHACHVHPPEFKAWRRVVLNGWGVGETHYGGYAQLARVKGDWLVKMPAAFTPRKRWRSARRATPRCCACWRWRAHGVKPASGAVLVTGAAGGVGSVAIACWPSSATT